MNPTDYESWPYSSWPYYTQGWQTDWVQQHKIFELFEGGDYREFVRSYEPIADEVKYLKAMLAS